VGLFRRRPDPSDPVPPTGIRGYDLAVLDAMREGGVDLTKPRGVEFFMLLPDSAAASAAADEAAVRGWDTRIDEPGPDEDLDAWDVHCMRSNVVLTEEFVRDGRLYFEDLAARHRGELDGWEADAA
jgi:hypothetical protein